MTLHRWNSFQYDSQGWIHTNTTRQAGGGQNGYGSIRATLGADASALLGFSSGETEIIVGFCHRVTTMNAGRILQILNSTGTVLCGLAITAAGEIIVNRSTGTEIGRSLPGVIAPSVEAYIEFRVVMDTTTGEAEVRVNGNPNPVVNLSGVNTGAEGGMAQVQFYSTAQGTRDHSAFYLVIVDATAPNDFLGHIRFGILDPNGNGASSQFDGSDGNSTDNYLLVDDATGNDGDTTYVQSSTLNEIDTYAMGNMPTPSSSIIAVCPVIHARKTDAGTRAARAVIRRSGTDYPGSADLYLGNTYVAYRTAYLTDPSTAAAWSDAGVDALEAGVKVTV